MSRTPDKRHSDNPAPGAMSMNTSLDKSTPHKASSHTEAIATKVLAVRAAVTAEMEGTWVAGTAHYLDAILGSEPPLQCIENFITESPLYANGRWTGIPRGPIRESQLYEPVPAIINAVLDYFDRSSARQAVDSSSTMMSHGSVDHELYSSPDMVIIMNGKMVDPDTPADDATSKTEEGQEIEKGSEGSGTDGGSRTDGGSGTDEGSGDDYLPTGEQHPLSAKPSYRHAPFAKPSYKNVASFVEMKQNIERSANNFRPQIATYAREIFIQQHNRQHVFGMLLTEETAEVYQFDRAGAIHTSRVDIHSDPCTFVRMILCITSMDYQALGFDESIYWSAGKRYLKVGDVNYVILNGQPAFLRRAIRGRGTTGWIVQVPGSKTLFFIKDYWKAENRPYESEYLQAAKGLLGVAQMITCENNKSFISAQRKVVLGAFLSDRLGCVIGDRALCRLVMNNCGLPIEHFPDPKQLLSTMRDAINGHQALFKIRILHRDVSMMNVLLCPTDSPGQFRGVLTDLDLAVSLDRDETLAKCDYRTGTRFYQSIHVLRAEGQHDHLDDLESFFYLFCMLCLGYSGPGQAIVPTPSVFHGWEMDCPEVAAGVKTGFVLSHRKRVEVSLVVSPSVKEVFSTVVASLRAFVMKKYLAKSERVEAQQDAARAGQERAPVAINKDFMAVADGEYTEFLGIIGEAIDELAQAETESSGAPDRLGVDLSDSTGYEPRSFAPVPEMPVASGSGNKRVSESEQSSQPPRKRSRLSKGRALPTSA